ncbi:hypothetical protein ABIA32_003949 [Streptacidiphilus sp. MAP12-20]|uniref:hypothetical protein n=1 Tax=Streptacidiphilus sp. MAP12-20 TaxID=3156299 RepID=UPI00351418BE
MLVTESTTGWVAPALGEALTLGVPVSVGEAEPAGLGESVGVGVADGEAESVAVEEDESLGDELSDGVLDADGLPVEVTLAVGSGVTSALADTAGKARQAESSAAAATAGTVERSLTCTAPGMRRKLRHFTEVECVRNASPIRRVARRQPPHLLWLQAARGDRIVVIRTGQRSLRPTRI